MPQSLYAPPHKTIHEAESGHQTYHPLPFTVDRTNLFIGRVEYHIFEAWDKPDPDLLDIGFGNGTVARDAGILDMVFAASTKPLCCVGVERRYDAPSSMAIYTYTFEGLNSKHDTQYIEFELEFTMEQMPIETHPSFQRLNDIYGPYDSLNRLWPPIVTAASAATGLGATSSGGPVSNPIYGVTTYNVPGCVFRMTFTDSDVDQGAFNNVGVRVENPPKIGQAFPNIAGLLKKGGAGFTRDWLKMAPKIRQHGACVQITEEYMLSGPRGWTKQIYDLEWLQGQTI
jgi:hypothetical protein